MSVFDIKFTRQGLRTLVDIILLAEHSTCVLKLDINRRKPGILFISLQATSNYDVIIDFRVDSMSLMTSFKKCNVMMT